MPLAVLTPGGGHKRIDLHDGCGKGKKKMTCQSIKKEKYRSKTRPGDNTQCTLYITLTLIIDQDLKGKHTQRMVQ